MTMIVSCPTCRESVRLESGLSPQAEIRCPWCRDSYTVQRLFEHLPPAFEVLSNPAAQSAGASLSSALPVAAMAAVPNLEDNSLEMVAESDLVSNVSPESQLLHADPFAFESDLDRLESERRAESEELETVELESWEAQDAANQGGINNPTSEYQTSEFTEELQWSDEPADADEVPVTASELEHDFEVRSEEYALAEDSTEGIDSNGNEMHAAESSSGAFQPKTRKRRPPPSPIKTGAQILGGGVAGIGIAAAILWYIDPSKVTSLFGISPPSTAAVNPLPGNRIDSKPMKMPDFSSIQVPSLEGDDAQKNSRSMQDLGSDLNKTNAANQALSPPDMADNASNAADSATKPEDAASPNGAEMVAAEPKTNEPKSSEHTVAKEVSSDALPNSAATNPAKEEEPKGMSLSARTKLAAATSVYLRFSDAPTKHGAALYVSLASLAGSLPEGTQLPHEVLALIEGVAEEKEFIALTSEKVVPAWWDKPTFRLDTEKKPINGIFAVGEVANGGKSLKVNEKLELPLIAENVAFVDGQKVLLFGKIQGTDKDQVIVTTGIMPLPIAEETDKGDK